jgi:hypothetical protein
MTGDARSLGLRIIEIVILHSGIRLANSEIRRTIGTTVIAVSRQTAVFTIANRRLRIEACLTRSRCVLCLYQMGNRIGRSIRDL